MAEKKTRIPKWASFIILIAVLSTITFGGYFYLQRSHIAGVPFISSNNSELSIGSRNTLNSADLQQEQGQAVEQALLNNVYETIVYRDDNNALQPGLAKSWDISDDGLTYKFNLRKNITFSNGDSLTATDVVSSLQNGITKGYVGYDKLLNISNISYDDDYTFTISLSSPSPTLLRVLSTRAGAVYDSKNPNIGSGPYTISNFEKNKQLVLQANNKYWNTAPQTNQITIHYYSSDEDEIKAYQNNEIDVAYNLTPASAQSLKDENNTTITDGSSDTKIMLAFNNNKDTIYSDIRIRQATRYAIDAASIAQQQIDSAGAIGGIFTPIEAGYEDLTGLFPYDAKKALSYFAYFSASYVGKNVILCPKEYEALGNAIADNLKNNSRFT
ncbi:MAG: ABC transporter substrate-binding protein, partial [Bifidobacteriaceae bacterium]|nr:ABC transporter substrate-binding protein [Bifidobacteriaceae bacterium]